MDEACVWSSAHEPIPPMPSAPAVSLLTRALLVEVLLRVVHKFGLRKCIARSFALFLIPQSLAVLRQIDPALKLGADPRRLCLHEHKSQSSCPIVVVGMLGPGVIRGAGEVVAANSAACIEIEDALLMQPTVSKRPAQLAQAPCGFGSVENADDVGSTLISAMSGCRRQLDADTGSAPCVAGVPSIISQAARCLTVRI